jgi:hypothetical protein
MGWLTLLALLAVAGLSCSLFVPEATPAPTVTAAPTATDPVPDGRPADFSVRYDWAEGSLPPPYHYEYTVSAGPGNTLTITMIPDYPSDDVPTWTETAPLDDATLDALFALAVEQGAFTTAWQQTDDIPVGGSSWSLTLTAGGREIDIPAYLIETQTAAAEAIANAVVALVPADAWARLNSLREDYVAEHEE